MILMPRSPATAPHARPMAACGSADDNARWIDPVTVRITQVAAYACAQMAFFCVFKGGLELEFVRDLVLKVWRELNF